MTDVFVEMCLVYCDATVVVEQEKKNPLLNSLVFTGYLIKISLMG